MYLFMYIYIWFMVQGLRLLMQYRNIFCEACNMGILPFPLLTTSKFKVQGEHDENCLRLQHLIQGFIGFRV